MTADGYTWLNVNYENDIDGWSADVFLEKLDDKKVRTKEDNIRVRKEVKIEKWCESHYNKESYALDLIDKKDRGKEKVNTYGKEVIAADSGVVYQKKMFKIDYNGSYGTHIILKHDNSVYYVYAHLSEFSKTISNKKVGDVVKKGESIGLIGYTGIVKPNNKLGSHLHFVVYREILDNEDRKACKERGHYSSQEIEKCAVLAEPLSGCVNIEEGDILQNSLLRLVMF